MTWRADCRSQRSRHGSNKDGNFTDRPIINGALLARNSFRQPNFWNTDLRVSKSIRFTERHNAWR